MTNDDDGEDLASEWWRECDGNEKLKKKCEKSAYEISFGHRL